MFVSCLDARRLLLPAVRWAGDADVTHTDGSREIVHDVKVCERRFCNNTFTPKQPEQMYCGRSCSFKQLRYSRNNDLWRGIVEHRGYKVKGHNR